MKNKAARVLYTIGNIFNTLVVDVVAVIMILSITHVINIEFINQILDQAAGSYPPEMSNMLLVIPIFMLVQTMIIRIFAYIAIGHLKKNTGRYWAHIINLIICLQVVNPFYFFASIIGILAAREDRY